jgi:hypothetical protein
MPPTSIIPPPNAESFARTLRPAETESTVPASKTSTPTPIPPLQASEPPEPASILQPSDPQTGRVSASVTFVQQYISAGHGVNQAGETKTMYFRNAGLVRRLEKNGILTCSKMVAAPELT